MERILKILTVLFAVMMCCTAKAQLIKGNQRLEEYLPMVENKNVAIVCNHTSMVENKHIADTLIGLGVKVKILFTPEHGLKGTEEAGKSINGVFYYKDSIKICSLYGKNKKPTAEQMSGVDAVLFDLQDVGCRFYTYISTLEYVMKACIETNTPLIVLDRPNPNNFVAGPVLRSDCRSFVGMQSVPICYGLTIGEYAVMINEENLADSLRQCSLHVVRMQNYNRDSVYTLDVWPSPNLQSMQAIKNYPTLCLFEGTPVSVGRGTDMPFEIIGFPEYKTVSKTHKGKSLEFTPRSIKGVAENPPFKDRLCKGEKIVIQSNDIELDWIINMYRQYPKKEGFFIRMFDLLSGDKNIKQQIIDGKTSQEIKQQWESGLEAYKQIRQKYLLY